MKKKAITLLLVLGMLVFVGCAKNTTQNVTGNNVEKPKLQKIVVAEAARGELWGPTYLAKGLGYFEEEGLDVSFVTFHGASLTSGLINGDAQFGLLGYEMVLKLDEKGIKTKMLYSTTSKFPYSLVANSGITSIADLKGKKISAAGVGTSPYAFVRLAVKSGGLDPDKDVTLVGITSTSSILPAAQKGEVNASYAWGSLKIQLLKNGGNVLIDMDDPAVHQRIVGTPNYNMYVAQVTDKYIKENPENVQKFVNAVYKAMLWQQNHTPQEIADKISTLFPERTGNVLVENLTEIKKVYSKDGYFTKDAHDAAVRLSIEANMITKPIPMENVVDDSFLKKAHAKLDK